MKKKIRIFDLNSLDTAPTVLPAFDGSVNHVIPLLHHPHLIMASGAAKGIKIYDLRTGTSETTLSTSANVNSLTVSMDGSLISSAQGTTCVIYDAKSFDVVASHTLSRDIDCIAVSAETKKFVTGSNSELWAHIYDLQSGTEISIHKGHHGPVRSVAFSPTGLTFGSGSEDGTIRIWQTPTSESK